MTVSTDELILPIWNDDVEEVRRLLNNDDVNINYKREDTDSDSFDSGYKKK